MNVRANLRQDPIGFQLAPMLDVVFLLLCFFMTSQLFAQWEQEIGITLPTAESAETARRLPGEVVLNIAEDGRVIVNGRVMDDIQLSSMLRRLTAVVPGQPVVIRGDRMTRYEDMIRVLDLCRLADLWNVSFAIAAEPAEASP